MRCLRSDVPMPLDMLPIAQAVDYIDVVSPICTKGINDRENYPRKIRASSAAPPSWLLATSYIFCRAASISVACEAIDLMEMGHKLTVSSSGQNLS
jgi:hypothetical protein